MLFQAFGALPPLSQMWMSAWSTVRQSAELIAVRTLLAPTAAHRPAILAISLHQGEGARVSAHWALGKMWMKCGGSGRSVDKWTLCWLQMWMSVGTGPSAVPTPCVRTCLAPSSASVTRATRGHGTGVTASVRGSREGAGWERGGEAVQTQSSPST